MTKNAKDGGKDSHGGQVCKGEQVVEGVNKEVE